MMINSLKRVAQILSEQDNILILVHAHPDGDTLGCGYSLCRSLLTLGKKARVSCSDEIPNKYSYLSRDIEPLNFMEDFVVAVDVADTKLLGSENEDKYKDKIDLCIDHHASNRLFAKQTYLDSSAAAACEIMLQVIMEMGVEITPATADCIYTGLSTDTGCFRYSNVTPRTMKMGGEMIEAGAAYAQINTVMFDTKTKTFLALQKLCLEGLEMHFDGKCALITITQDMFQKSGSNESECDAISALSRQVEGVTVGATLREKADGSFKVSLRTHAPIDASAICAKMNGGGHQRAAGAQLDVPLVEAKEILLKNIKDAIEKSKSS